MNVEILIEELIGREGGFVNDPDDPGGATKYGITIATLSSYRGHGAKVKDVQDLTKEEAALIYKRRYLYAPKIDQLPQELIPTVFDMYVNAGSNAIKILQRTINKFGNSLHVDGALGPKSLGAVYVIYDQAGQYLVDAYGVERREYYYSLADQRPASRKYARTRAGGKGGWIKRAEEFVSERFRLSDAAHRQRIAAWG